MISLCMIVKNEENYLRGCLESVKNVVDEIIITDTGSTDNTIKIAEELGAKIFSFNWIDDFSAARNYSLSQASGDWILYLDADERLDRNSIEIIKKLTDSKKDAGYRCKVISKDEIGKHPSIMSYVRLFPTHEKIKFTGRIHEQIEPALRENNFIVEDSDIEIIHLGYNITADSINKKAERNLTLLLKGYSETRSSYYAYQLGQTYGILKNEAAAEKYFLEALNDLSLNKEYRSVAYRYLAINAADKKEFDKSLLYIEKSLAEDEQQPLALMAAAKIYAKFKMADKAAEAALKAYNVNKLFLEKRISSSQNILMDEEELCYHGIETAAAISGRDLFNFFYEKIIKNNPATEIMVLHDLYNGKAVDEKNINNFVEGIKESSLDSLLALLENYLHTDCAIKILKLLSARFNKNASVHFMLGKKSLESKDFNSAGTAFEKTVSLNPEDPSYYFYLISVYLQNSNYEKLASTLKTTEEKFSSDPEIYSKVNLLKQKLSAHFA